MHNKSKNAGDVALLAFIRIVTIAGNFISVAILSRALSLNDYGIYSAGNLIVSVASATILLGFSDAANYYFNLNSENREKYINTVFFLQFAIGLLCAAVVFAGRRLITSYFGIEQLNGLYIYFIFRPMLSNMVVSLQPLQSAVGKARLIAFWNVVVMAFKLMMVILTAYVTKDVLTVFISLLIVDIITVSYYALNFGKNAFRIRVFKFDAGLIKEILRFSVPMGIYILANSLMKDMDKLVIGYFESADSLAIYTNCSAQLPVGIITTAFFTVAMPMITRSVQQNDNAQAGDLCSAYLKMGYITTTILGMACIVLAPEAIKLLYGDPYLSGVWVFVLYVVVDMIKFANTTIILTAKGRTDILMKISLVSLAVNAVLNLAMYKMFGFVGPAIATVTVSLGMTYVMLRLSAQTVEARISELLDVKCILRLAAAVAVMSAAALWARKIMTDSGIHYLLILLTVGGLYCAVLFALNFKEIMSTLKILDNK